MENLNKRINDLECEEKNLLEKLKDVRKELDDVKGQKKKFIEQGNRNMEKNGFLGEPIRNKRINKNSEFNKSLNESRKSEVNDMNNMDIDDNIDDENDNNDERNAEEDMEINGNEEKDDDSTENVNIDESMKNNGIDNSYEKDINEKINVIIEGKDLEEEMNQELDRIIVQEDNTITEELEKHKNVILEENIITRQQDNDRISQEMIVNNKRKRQDEDSIGTIEKKRKIIDDMIEKLNVEIIEEKTIDNKSQITTEELMKFFKEMEILGKFVEKSVELEKLKLYNYAESFQLRIKEELRNDSAKVERTARTKIYREMMEIGKFSEGQYGNLRKWTQRAENFYRIINLIGGKEKIKVLKGISVNMIVKLTKI